MAAADAAAAPRLPPADAALGGRADRPPARPGRREGWTAAGIDEFLRGYCTPAGRFAFYECARNIYMEEPYGTEGFWTRMKKLETGGAVRLGPSGHRSSRFEFMRHVERGLPQARHLELDCGHVPQLEKPGATHDAVRDFLLA